MFEDVYRVDQLASAVEESAVEALDDLLGGRTPAGYKEFVTELGDGVCSGYVRVYPPARVLAEYESVQDRVQECFFWDDGSSVATRDDLVTAVIVADTLGGDEVFVHPDTDRILVLPREESGIYAFPNDLRTVLGWLLTSGTLTPALPQPPTFETAGRQSHRGFAGAPGLTQDAVAEAVAALAGGARRDDVADGDEVYIQQFLPVVGGYVFVSGEGEDLFATFSMVTSASTADVEAVTEALLGAGLVRST
ncbi:hypothetical protein [Sanguibacter antarcticus]|nr:hypothetical protein [Sanguibacter antarcticus]